MGAIPRKGNSGNPRLLERDVTRLVTSPVADGRGECSSIDEWHADAFAAAAKGYHSRMARPYRTKLATSGQYTPKFSDWEELARLGLSESAIHQLTKELAIRLLAVSRAARPERTLTLCLPALARESGEAVAAVAEAVAAGEGSDVRAALREIAEAEATLEAARQALLAGRRQTRVLPFNRSSR